jgi:penicillin-binding protein 1A
MRDVVDRGTGTAVRGAGFSQPAAGKTGTTNESADVWFIGFTPDIVTGVWMGMDDPQRIMSRATGGLLAAPVWGRIMTRVATGSSGWTAPPGIEKHMVDARGNIVGADCPTIGEVREEFFLRGSVNTSSCREYLYGYDSLGADTLYEDDASWWRRLRERVFRDEGGADTTRTDRPRPDTTIIERTPRDVPRDTFRMELPRERDRDTVRLRPQRPDTTPRPTPPPSVEPDTLLGVPATPRDTTPDTTPRFDASPFPARSTTEAAE